MRIIYACGICGHSSENREEIVACERRGRNHKFSLGQEVIFLLAPRGMRVPLRAKVSGMSFGKGTRDVRYDLVVYTDDAHTPLPSLGSMFDAGMKEGVPFSSSEDLVFAIPASAGTV